MIALLGPWQRGLGLNVLSTRKTYSFPKYQIIYFFILVLPINIVFSHSINRTISRFIQQELELFPACGLEKILDFVCCRYVEKVVTSVLHAGSSVQDLWESNLCPKVWENVFQGVPFSCEQDQWTEYASICQEKWFPACYNLSLFWQNSERRRTLI